MNPSTVIALVALSYAIIGTPLGFFIKGLITRASVAEQLAEARKDTIHEQARQIDRLEISAQIADRFMSQAQFPRTPDPGPR